MDYNTCIAFTALCIQAGHTVELVQEYVEAAQDAEDDDVFASMGVDARFADFQLYLEFRE
jgi:hypothetical protein